MNTRTVLRKRYVASNLACLCLLGFACATNIFASTYYVAINGNNANSGSQGSPWLTIQYAASRVSAGDTVRVANGTYNERVTPPASGTPGNFINFVGSPTGTGVVMYGFTIQDKSYIRIIGFEIRHVNNTSHRAGVRMFGTCSHIEVLDNYIHDTSGEAIHGAIGSTPNYITIRGNTIYYVSHPGSLAISDAAIANSYITPNHWLIEYNHIQRSMDFVDIYGSNNIVRNNWLHDFDQSYWSSYGHPDFFQPGSGGVATGTSHHVYERNFCGDSTDIDSHFGIWLDTVDAGDTHMLIRGNVGYNIGGGGIGVIGTDRVMTYNNTFHELCTAWKSAVFVWYQEPTFGGVCANTIISDDRLGTDAIYVEAGHDVKVTNNLGYLAGSEASYVSTSNPLFVNAPNRKFRLQPGSPAINAGTHLVWITSAAGSGTTFNVNDGDLFIDGWGMVDGDTIAVGGTTTRITGINGNTLTVTNSVAWTNGTPVYWGTDTSPDIGALPFGSTELTAATLAQNGTTYTVTPTGDARGVWFYVDGIPTTWDSTAPFTATIPIGSVTAKAYALYAQENPVVAAGLGGPAPLSPPSISLQPMSQTNVMSQSVTFTVGADGNPAPSYTWQTNNGSGSFVNVASGGNSPSWTTPPLAIGMNGWNVRVALTNSQGYLLSDTVYIGVTNGAAPVISVQPQNATTTAGGAANFTVVASGGALSYQWRLGWAAIPGATTSVYTMNNVPLAANGNQYSVVITNGWGAITSQVATLTVNNTTTNVWNIGNTWTTFGLASANDGVQFSFDAFVSHPDADFGIGFSPNVVDAWNDMGPIVLFDASGVIYARNAGVYMADTTISYAPNTWYHISGTVNIPTHRYSVSVNGTLIATNYAFRTEQAGATQLSNFGATEGYSSVAIVSNLVWTPYVGRGPSPAPPTNLRVQ